MNLLSEIPARVRKIIYVTFTLIGVAFGATQVAYASVEGASQPDWLTVALVVYAYIGTALGLTAASNTPAPEEHGKHEKGAVNWALAIIVAVVALLALLLLVRPGLR